MPKPQLYPLKHLAIKNWLEDDQPREKLNLHGRKIMSNAELLAIVLNSGTRNLSAVALAQRVLDQVGNDLGSLNSQTLEALCSMKGIGKAKGIRLIAALELGERVTASTKIIRTSISCSQSAYTYLAPSFSGLLHEEFWALYLNTANKPVAYQKVSQGGVSGTIVDNRVLFRPALQYLASKMILAHNHPSGRMHPSLSDIKVTKKIKSTGVMLDIEVVDHLIIGHQRYLSFADEGLI